MDQRVSSIQESLVMKKTKRKANKGLPLTFYNNVLGISISIFDHGSFIIYD